MSRFWFLGINCSGFFFSLLFFCLLGVWMLEFPSNPAAIFHRKGGEGWGQKGGDPNPEEVGGSKGGSSKGGGPQGEGPKGGGLEWGLRRVRAPKGGGPQFRALSSLSGVFSWNFGGV